MFQKSTIKKGTKKLSHDAQQSIVIVAALGVLMLVFGSLSPYFLTLANIAALLTAAVPLGLVGIGECVCLITGQFDMSVGMVASLAGVIWVLLITELGMPVYAAFLIALLFGVLSGLLAGISVAYWNMPAWMATYALFQIWQGIIYILTNGEAVRMTSYPAFKYLGQHKILGTAVTWAVVIMVAAYIIMYFVLKHTKLGRDLFIVGGNPEAARNVGIRIRFTHTFVFVLSGVLSALAGLLFASRSGSGQPVIGSLYAMQAIAGAVVGGTAMTGGKANVLLTFVGIMIVVCLQNGLNMVMVPSFYQHIAIGVTLIFAILVQTKRLK
jgi:ribose transport system permease protein